MFCPSTQNFKLPKPPLCLLSLLLTCCLCFFHVLQTFLYGTSSYHIEPTFEDETDDIELFLESSDTPTRAERLPQLAMSLFRKPELGNPWAHYRNSSSEDEDEEDYELGSSPEPEDAEQESSDALDSDIALLRDSMAQREAEKHEKSYAVSLLAPARVLFFSPYLKGKKNNTKHVLSHAAHLCVSSATGV